MVERIILVRADEDGYEEGGVDIVPRTKPFVLGRASDSDLFVPDSSTSRIHCQIEWVDGTPFLKDLGSRLGSIVNGRTISVMTALQHEDLVEIGETKFRVLFVESDQHDKPDLQEQVVSEPAPPRFERSSSFQEQPTLLPDAPMIKEPSRADGERTLVSDSFEDPEIQDHDLRLDVPQEGLILGRGDECDCVLASPMVSRRHAKLVRVDGAVSIEDLRSANGTFLNGVKLAGVHRLCPGDSVRVGPYDFEYDGRVLVAPGRLQGTSIELRQVGTQVNHLETGQPIWLLRDISLTIHPGEFVGIFGSSGCGKSTLVDAMNGRRPAGCGSVLYAEQDLYESFGQFKTGIGHVPQELVLHEILSVEDALRYAAKLRLPADTDEYEIEQSVDRLLDLVKLDHRRDVRIGDLSGGQKKRVSIAMEMLFGPSVLFLDEATSGLDLVTESEMTKLFEELAEGGVTTICITHHAQSLSRCNMVAYLMEGRLAYFGPPDRLLEHFGVDDMREVYLKEKERTAEAWAEHYASSAAHKEYVEGRASSAETPAADRRLAAGEATSQVSAEKSIKQWRTLCARYIQIICSDRRHLLLLLALAPVLSILTRMRFSVGDPIGSLQVFEVSQRALVFSAGLSAFFLGIFGSIREVVKEDRLYRHERFTNLEILPYLGSKLVPLVGINAIQAALLLFCFDYDGGLSISGKWNHVTAWLALVLTAASGTALGLAISSAVRTASQAMLVMILVIVPQILYTNAFKPDLTEGAKIIADCLIVVHWSYLMLTSAADTVSGSGVVSGEFEVFPFVGRCTMFLFGFVGVYLTAAVLFLKRKDGPYWKLYAIPKVRRGVWIAMRSRVRAMWRRVLGQDVRAAVAGEGDSTDRGEEGAGPGSS